jgi:hypothetical protein
MRNCFGRMRGRGTQNPLTLLTEPVGVRTRSCSVHTLWRLPQLIDSTRRFFDAMAIGLWAVNLRPIGNRPASSARKSQRGGIYRPGWFFDPVGMGVPPDFMKNLVLRAPGRFFVGQVVNPAADWQSACWQCAQVLAEGIYRPGWFFAPVASLCARRQGGEVSHSMNDDVSRRGCSPETSTLALILKHLWSRLQRWQRSAHWQSAFCEALPLRVSRMPPAFWGSPGKNRR